MRSIIAIDPGYGRRTLGCACALFVDRHVVHTWYARPTEARQPLRVPKLECVVIEMPQQDGRSRSAPPEVLIRLAWDGALLAGMYAGETGASVVALQPRAWKGSKPKPISHRKLWALLEPHERTLLGGDSTYAEIIAACERGACDRWDKPGASYYPANWLMHNTLDAAAMGCAFLMR
jgi:hypothetical protein